MYETRADLKVRTNLTTFDFTLLQQIPVKRDFVPLCLLDRVCKKSTKKKTRLFTTKKCFTHWNTMDTSEWSEHKMSIESYVIHSSLFQYHKHIPILVAYSPCRFICYQNVHPGRTCVPPFDLRRACRSVCMFV